MRFAVVAVLFIVAVFGFFVGYAVGSLLLTEVGDVIMPLGVAEVDAMYYYYVLLLVFCVLLLL